MASEKLHVEMHLPHCSDCQNTVALFSLLQQSAAQHTAGESLPEDKNQLIRSGDHTENFQKLLARIELDDATSGLENVQHLPPQKPNRFGLFPQARHAYGLAAACVSFFLIGGLTFLTLNSGEFDFIHSAQDYHTLSDASVNGVAVEDGKQFRVLFHRDTTDTQIQLILAEVNAQMASGPSARGVYTIQVSPSVNKSVDEILAALRNQTQVVLAEPVIE